MSIDPASAKIIKDAVTRSAFDPPFFLRFFLPHWFPSALPAFHLGMAALITKKVEFLNNYPDAHEFLLTHFHYEPDMRDTTAEPVPVFWKGEDGKMRMRIRDNLNLIIPRGYSKTTLTKGLSIYDALTDPTLFLVFISETASHSETQVNDIKTELETNERLRLAYGNQVPTKSDSEKWTAKELHLKCGAIITSRGRGGQVRGMTFDGRRPNKVVLDDVEDDESVKTKEQREKTSSWFYGAVVPAGQIMEGAAGEDWAQEPLQIIVLGTILGAECLVRSLTSDIDFGTIRFGAVVDEQKQEMLWAYKMSWDTYQAKRNRYRMLGRLTEFTREYDSLIRVSDEAIFPEVFIYQPTTRADLIAVGVALDPAISDSDRADEAAIGVVGRRESDGALWVLDEWNEKGQGPNEKLDQFFEMYYKWEGTHAGIEAVSYQASLLHLARERMARDKRFFMIEPIRHNSKTSKEARIVGMLSPRYMQGYLRHLRPFPGLEGNLSDWPDGKRDVADAVAMALSLLGESTVLRMEGALEDSPPIEQPPMPEMFIQTGNYMMRQHNSVINSGRYG